MNLPFITPKRTALDIVIDEALASLQELELGTEEYATAADQIAQLHALKEEKSKKSVSPDVVITVLANLAGILFILHHEQVNVVTSKALSFVVKPK